MLCKTYKRDTIFSESLTKLLQKLEDELVRERARLEKTEEKKKMYKTLARQFHNDFQSRITL